MQRRQFLSSTAAFTAASYKRISGAADRIGLGLIGCGGQGSADWRTFLSFPEVVPVAAADVYQPNLEKCVSLAGGRAQGFKDFRRLLDRKDVDAVLVATPDHWHALATIMACQAGKDVYCEKPLSLTIREGKAMVAAARAHNRVVQTGSQQRSGAHYAEAVAAIQGGKLGNVAHVSVGHIRNVMPGYGRYPDSAPPPGLDWEMWLGPAPYRPYNRLRCLYHFRWFWDYSGGQMTNFGAHDLDIVRWALNVRAPLAVTGFGGRYALRDGGETPDVQEVVYQFPHALVVWSVREMNGADHTGFEFHGTDGNLKISRKGYEITRETQTGGDADSAKVKKVPRTTSVEERSVKADASALSPAHVKNFLECLRSRKRPNADIEEGYLSAVLCHIGNIATRLGRRLRWDAEAQQFIGDAEANKWLERPYRAPWKLPEA